MIFIDYNDKRPIYEQVTEKIQTLILNGVLESDSKLPSVRSLAMELSINPNTIQRAYSELEREGFIYSVKGRGNFVKMNENLIIKEQEKLLIKFKANVEELRARGILKEQPARRDSGGVFQLGGGDPELSLPLHPGTCQALRPGSGAAAASAGDEKSAGRAGSGHAGSAGEPPCRRTESLRLLLCDGSPLDHGYGAVGSRCHGGGAGGAL